MELWDLYDQQRRPLGRTHKRGMPLQKGEYHLVVFVWVFNNRGEVLLTKRAPEKRTFANLWEATGGAVQAGENSRQAICRELFEETGIRAEASEFLLMDTDCRSDGICDIYFLRKTVPLEQLVMQPGETCGAKWVDRAELERMLAAGLVARPDAYRYRQLGDKLNGFLR